MTQRTSQWRNTVSGSTFRSDTCQIGLQDVGPEVKVGAAVYEHRDMPVNEVVAPPIGGEHPAALALEVVGGRHGRTGLTAYGRGAGREVRAQKQRRCQYAAQWQRNTLGRMVSVLIGLHGASMAHAASAK